MNNRRFGFFVAFPGILVILNPSYSKPVNSTKPKQMKITITQAITGICSLAALAFLLAGCSKPQSSSTPSTEQTQKATAPAADTMKKAAETTEPAAPAPDTAQKAADVTQAAAPVADAAKQTADTAKATAETVVVDTTKQAEAAAAPSAVPTSGNAQEWIDKAKSFVADGKLQEASSIVQQLAALRLTPEQQQLVDDLKAQIQKALGAKAATEGAAAVGNLLKK